jgi:hypothetical protein
MKNIGTVLFGMLFLLSLFNYDFSKLSPFEVSKSNIVDLIIIVAWFLAMVFQFRKREPQEKKSKV